MKSMGAFPVKRDMSDMKSVSDAVNLLEQEKQVGIFPQGKIVKDKTFDIKSGAALIAIKTQSPILPVSIHTNKKIRPFSKITVTFGKIIFPAETNSRSHIKQARKLTQNIKEQIIIQLKEGNKCQ